MAKMNKKAQIRDGAFILMTLTSIAITILIAGYLYNQIDAGFADSGLETNESSVAFDSFSLAFTAFDGGYAFIVIGMILALLVSSFFIPTHPIFIFVNILGIMILIFLGSVFSNLYSTIVAQPGLNATALQYFPISSFIALKLPWIGAIIIFLSTIVMYSKGKGGDSGY